MLRQMRPVDSRLATYQCESALCSASAHIRQSPEWLATVLLLLLLLAAHACAVRGLKLSLEVTVSWMGFLLGLDCRDVSFGSYLLQQQALGLQQKSVDLQGAKPLPWPWLANACAGTDGIGAVANRLEL